MKTRTLHYEDGTARRNDAVKKEAEKIGAVDYCGYYQVEVEQWDDANALAEALHPFTALGQREQIADRKPVRKNTYRNFN